jgi:cephalosporin hydroxylase
MRIIRPIARAAYNLITAVPYWMDATRTMLPLRVLNTIQRGSFRYEHRGVTCIKNPFDLALYALLIGRTKPRTIIEIGSAHGGSALWFADQMRINGILANIVSLDINRVEKVTDDGVRFLQGDIHDLAASELPTILATCPRPLMVVEDGPHTFEGCSAALAFFSNYLRSGEYIVIEDGILRDIRMRELRNGPNRAIAQFIAGQTGRFLIDRDYCDFFGHNVTWNTNGYLRRV